MNRILRSLVLACSLTFVLPQGWCCLLALPTTENVAAAKSPTFSKAGSSGCCCPCTAPRPSEPKRPPTKSENIPTKRVPIPNCPCTDRKATPPTTLVEKIGDTFTFIDILPGLDLRPHLAGVVEHAISVSHSPPRHLHILHCLWLC
jgi:hypothetical protein